MAQFNMLERRPVAHTFRDTDGAVYEVRTARMFGTNAYARLAWLQSELPDAMEELQNSEGDDEKILPAARRLDQVVNEFFQMLAPDMPLDRVYELALADKLLFIQWWQQEEQKTTPRGEAVTARPIRGKRSRGSSSTATIPSES